MKKILPSSKSTGNEPSSPPDIPSEVFVVAKTIGGYAREDVDVAEVVGVFTCKTTAEKVALLSQARCFPIELNKIQPGFLQSAHPMGVDLTSPQIVPSKPARPR